MGGERFWAAVDCNKCKDSEKLYFCVDCGKFYCEHCLIPYSDHLGCPSGKYHKIIKVEDFFARIREEVVTKIDKFSELGEKLLEINREFKAVLSSIISLKIMKAYSFTILGEELSTLMSELERYINKIEEKIDLFSIQYPNQLTDIFKRFSEGRLTESLKIKERVLSELPFEENGLETLKKKIEELKAKGEREVTKFADISRILTGYLLDEEYFVSIIPLKRNKNDLLVITNKRLISLKNSKVTDTRPLSNIQLIETKKNIIFKGIEIRFHDGYRLKIHCENYDCFNIRQKIDQAKHILTVETKVTTEDIKFLENKINEKIGELEKKKKDLKISIVEYVAAQLKKLLSPYYYNMFNNGSLKPALPKMLEQITGNRIKNYSEKTPYDEVDERAEEEVISKNFYNRKKTPNTLIISNKTLDREHVERKNIDLNNDLGRISNNKRKSVNNVQVDDVLTTLRALRKYKKKLQDDFDEGKISPDFFYTNYFKIEKNIEKLISLLNRLGYADLDV
ncbi:MAG: PH domain-containing protein [Candidatus Njordarchaeia archaeon]